MAKVTKVSYSKSFEMLTPLGTVWEKIGLEAEIGERETPEQGLEELKVIVDAFHESANPGAIIKMDMDVYSSAIAPKKKAAKMVPDSAIRLEYATAVAYKNDVVVANLESIYDFSQPIKADA